jgi:hypothetical protein
MEGCIKYFYLDSKGCLVYEAGLPKLCKVEPFRLPAEPPLPDPTPAPADAVQEPAGLLPLQEDPPFAPEETAAGDDPFMLDHPNDLFGDYVNQNGNDDFAPYYEGWNPYLM